MIQNVKVLSYLLLIVGGLMLVNIVLGTINGTMEDKFDWKKFLFGFLKAFINALCILAVCVLCDLFAQVLNMIEGIAISAEVITSLEIIAVAVAWCIDLFKEVLEKIKALKELKYISYDDVQAEAILDYEERYNKLRG